jgi:uncharacterized heparinase superfamily protein
MNETRGQLGARSAKPMEESVEALQRWWNTVRWLRPRQLYGRVWFRAYHPRPVLKPAPTPRFVTGRWVPPAEGEPSLLGPDLVSVLNETRSIASPEAWDAREIPKLWRYHLHYFDDLNARGAATRTAWHEALLARWVAENRPGRGTGWEPYPASLRIVNWIKWALAGGQLSPEARDSLAAQARWLDKRLEWHLLGNHLWSNAKALVFAGSFFSGSEADGWRTRGAQILSAELPEQVLADGGQFELSPMYHALALEDVLDLVNAANTWPGRLSEPLVARLRQLAPAMLHWLGCLCHPDGNIALFNDSALGVAPTHAQLSAYAARLAIEPAPGIASLERLDASGYVRVQSGPLLLLCDVGNIGPDYLPGHAHADSLSFECSIDGQRWVVDSGCSTYEPGPERLRQRGTAAHNTVVVDGRDSSEVWSSFRVAQRARPREVVALAQGERVGVEAAHDGYLERGGPLHRRRIEVQSHAIEIEDHLDGPFVSAEARLHLHPDVAVRPVGPQALVLSCGAREVHLSVEGGTLSLAGSTWHPGFNQSFASTVVVARFDATSLRCRLEVR